MVKCIKRVFEEHDQMDHIITADSSLQRWLFLVYFYNKFITSVEHTWNLTAIMLLWEM